MSGRNSIHADDSFVLYLCQAMPAALTQTDYIYVTAKVYVYNLVNI